MGFSWLGRRRQREEMVDALYAKAVAQARLPIFYAEREVPDCGAIEAVTGNLAQDGAGREGHGAPYMGQPPVGGQEGDLP